MIRTYTSQVNNLVHYQLCYGGKFESDILNSGSSLNIETAESLIRSFNLIR